ncbi:MAG TPA: short chain dehydrogenase [Bacteroidetes bacterium]|nr:short chain dehydrogenase [Bacteroidota bacterium]
MARPPVVWVTGAGSGIGRALAEAFASAGCAVGVTSRCAARITRVAASSARIVRCACDVRNSSSVRRAHVRIVRSLGPVDILVNNAGVTVFKKLLSTNEREFTEIVDTNLGGVYRATREVLPSMVRRRKGTIVTILSYAIKTTYTSSSAYTASKSGAEALLRVLREELRGKGIRVVNVIPGAVNTAMWPKTVRRSQADVMMAADELADEIVRASLKQGTVCAEEIVVRPRVGDLRL